jgi:hypothetical protein
MLDQQRNELTNVIARKSEEKKEQKQHQQTSLASINYDNLNDVDNCWSLYIYAMKSPVTRDQSRCRSRAFPKRRKEVWPCYFRYKNAVYEWI